MLESKNLRIVPLVLLMLSVSFAAGRQTGYSDGLYAEAATNKGLIVLRLEFEKTPLAAANFVGLAEGTIANDAFPAGTPFFDGTKWHRVVAGHVIQCGAPTGGKTSGPGYEFPNEIAPGLSHGREGILGMANSGPHTNSSQWYITLADRSYLDGNYTIFGEVVRGMDVVKSIVQGDEIRTLKIIRVGPAAESFRPTTESFKTLVAEAEVRVRREDAERKVREESLVAANWPRAAAGADGIKFVVLKEGTGQPAAAGSHIKASYTGKCLLNGMTFISTVEDGKPYRGEKPESFDFEVGRTKINPGLDKTLAQMKKGEKRLVIVPAEQAYGRNGFYARQREGEKRFVIAPFSLLVFEVEVLDILPPATK